MKMTTAFLERMERGLNTAVLCDILDELGYRHQAMSGRIFPLQESDKLAGVARTMLVYDVYELPQAAYAKEIEAVDALGEGDVAVCANPSCCCGLWGELMTHAAIARGARGAVIDGAVRDIAQIRALSGRFKVFAAGRNPLDSKGRCLVADYDCPIDCGGVRVCTGDLIFADIDGAVVVPAQIAGQVVDRAFAKIEGENLVRAALEDGMLLREAFDRYGIL